MYLALVAHGAATPQTRKAAYRYLKSLRPPKGQVAGGDKALRWGPHHCRLSHSAVEPGAERPASNAPHLHVVRK